MKTYTFDGTDVVATCLREISDPHDEHTLYEADANDLWSVFDEAASRGEKAAVIFSAIERKAIHDGKRVQRHIADDSRLWAEIGQIHMAREFCYGESRLKPLQILLPLIGTPSAYWAAIRAVGRLECAIKRLIDHDLPRVGLLDDDRETVESRVRELMK